MTSKALKHRRWLLLCVSLYWFQCSQDKGANSEDLQTLSLHKCSCSHSTQLILYVSRQHEYGHRVLRGNSVLSEGDFVQVRYRTVERNAMIVSVDGRGVVTVHCPFSPPCSTATTPYKSIFLPFSYRRHGACAPSDRQRHRNSCMEFHGSVSTQARDGHTVRRIVETGGRG